MPVVTPVLASILTVKAVLNLVPLEFDINFNPSLSDCILFRAKQINPLPCLAIKFIFCGVHLFATKTKSPSFSRLSSSTKMNNFPLFAILNIFSIEQNFFFIFLNTLSINHILNLHEIPF